MNTLYIVPTPIGNLEDITLRALRILREVSLIAAEDTRTSRKLLDHYQITTPLTSYHEHNKLTKLDAIFEALAGGDVALISDAGTPGISDPGHELIREALSRQVRVVPLPGPSAIITALIASGMPTNSYIYLGFLPRKAKALHDLLESLLTERRTLIAYESPNRLVETLAAIVEVMGNRPVAVARELTKLFEEVRRGAAADVLAHYQVNEPRGEITLVLGGANDSTAERWDENRVLAALRMRIESGEARRQSAKAVAQESGWDSREVYDLSLTIKSEGAG
ncbi:MAG TPA: 16S rRNA (cytidine(1402)-2'-O)-methyltransferase [Aggregatilineales bacterium]|nr:16S rRNA (cytidine(1402)-2'-O)-methyltransferase [Aggregatilineales bacterium]